MRRRIGPCGQSRIDSRAGGTGREVPKRVINRSSQAVAESTRIVTGAVVGGTLLSQLVTTEQHVVNNMTGEGLSKMKPSISHVIAGLVTMIFLIDAMTPLGITAGIIYLFPPGLTYWAPTRHAPVLAATGCSALLGVGFFASPSGLSPWSGLVNRMAGGCWCK